MLVVLPPLRAAWYCRPSGDWGGWGVLVGTVSLSPAHCVQTHRDRPQPNEVLGLGQDHNDNQELTVGHMAQSCGHGGAER